jgi:uncharacterized repeat protein (TIGR01451 family)
VLLNRASVRGDQDPRPADNRATVASTIVASADLVMAKIFSPDTPVAGDTVSYQLTVTNNGPSRATGLAITDPLDPAITFVGIQTTAGTCDETDGLISCAVPTLDPGDSVTVSIQATLPAGLSPALQNVASITATTPDPDPENNTGAATFQPTLQSSLSLEKVVTPATVAAGQVCSSLSERC